MGEGGLVTMMHQEQSSEMVGPCCRHWYLPSLVTQSECTGSRPTSRALTGQDLDCVWAHARSVISVLSSAVLVWIQVQWLHEIYVFWLLYQELHIDYGLIQRLNKNETLCDDLPFRCSVYFECPTSYHLSFHLPNKRINESNATVARIQ